jgi:hypothetical protein
MKLFYATLMTKSKKGGKIMPEIKYKVELTDEEIIKLM